jgi:hypothetical protein
MRICRRQFAQWMTGALAAPALALPARPKLLIVLVVKHLRPDYLEAVSNQLAPGGLRRLLEHGAYYRDCSHRASTFPSTTLATLATGAWPSSHGIVAGRWYDRVSRTLVTASPAALQATTLAAQFAAESGARVYSVAMEAGDAALFAGTNAARVFSMRGAGYFDTQGSAPEWLDAFNRARPVEAVHNARWMALGARADGPPLRTLIWDEKAPGEFQKLFNASPFAQSALFDLLGELVTRERLGQNGGPDMVCLVDGSAEAVAYETGGRSPLMRQMVLQLDKRVETLLTQLNRTPGEGAYSVVLVGGHGAPPAPATGERAVLSVPGEALAQAIDRKLIAAGRGKVEKYVYPFLYLDKGDIEAARHAAATAALDDGRVAAWYASDGSCSLRGEWETRFRNSFHARRSGDLMFAYLPEHVEETAIARGISYGSLYNYDVRVPLCFYGPPFRAASFETAIESVDLAPTLARAWRLPAPSSSCGRVLAEAFAE